MRKSKYKSKTIKQRKIRLFRNIDKVLDEGLQALAIEKIQQSAEVEQLIKVSPNYADINHFCLRIISLYENIVFKAVAFDAAQKRLVYTFESEDDWSMIKEFYTDYFTKQGWKIIDESDKLPNFNKVVVKTGNYKIMLCDISALGGYLLSGEKD